MQRIITAIYLDIWMPQQMAAAGRAEAVIGHPKIQQIVRFLCRHMRRHEEPKMQGGVTRTETLQIKRTSIDMRISGVLGFICIYVCFICADR